MPAQTFSKPITLTAQSVAGKPPASSILAVDKGRVPGQDDFYRFHLRAKARGWLALVIEGDHKDRNSRAGRPRSTCCELCWTT